MKNTIRTFLCAFILIAVTGTAIRAEIKPKSETVTIKTSAICNSCKNRIEKALKATEGVENVMLNLDNKKVKVKFNPEKVSAEKIREVIANTGYNADDVKRTDEAYSKLPRCCQGTTVCEH